MQQQLEFKICVVNEQINDWGIELATAGSHEWSCRWIALNIHKFNFFFCQMKTLHFTHFVHQVNGMRNVVGVITLNCLFLFYIVCCHWGFEGLGSSVSIKKFHENSQTCISKWLLDSVTKYIKMCYRPIVFLWSKCMVSVCSGFCDQLALVLVPIIMSY